MVIKFVCRNCGYVLLQYDYRSTHHFSPRSVITRYKGRCPNCGAELKLPGPDDITIVPRYRIKKNK